MSKNIILNFIYSYLIIYSVFTYDGLASSIREKEEIEALQAGSTLSELSKESEYYIENAGQGFIMEKMVKFLEDDLNYTKDPKDIENRKEVISKIKNSRGFCAGFSVLWAYANFVSDTKDKKSNLNDDLDFFFSARGKLAKWNSKTKLSKTDKKDLHRFISLVILFQEPAFLLFKKGGQIDLAVLLHDMKLGKPRNTLDLNITCTKEMLLSRLRKLVRPKQLTLLSTNSENGGHTMALFQHSGTKEIVFYDPGSVEGAFKVKSIEDLSDEFWSASDPSRFIEGFKGVVPVDMFLRSFNFKTFVFGKDDKYKPENFWLSGVEFSELVTKMSHLIWPINRVNKARLFQDQPNLTIFSFLNNADISDKEKINVINYISKSIINDQSIRFIDQLYNGKINSTLWARYLLKHSSDRVNEILSEKQKIELKKVASKRLEINLLDPIDTVLKKELCFEERLSIARKSPISSEVVTELFENYKPSKFEKSKIIGNNKDYIFDYILLVADYLKKNKIELAKRIIRSIGNKLDLLPNFKTLEAWKNIEITNFLEKEFSDREYYCDSFGTSVLWLWKIKIQKQIRMDKKNQLMKKVSEILDKDTYQSPENVKKGVKLVEELLKDEKVLTFKETIQLMGLIPFQTKLIDRLIATCEIASSEKEEFKRSPNRFGIGLSLSVDRCLIAKDISTAKKITSLVYDKTGFLPTYNLIMDWKSPEIVDFLEEKYPGHADYCDSFGTSVLWLWKVKIQKQIRMDKKNQLMKKASKIMYSRLSL